jgi:hypothetical protein
VQFDMVVGYLYTVYAYSSVHECVHLYICACARVCMCACARNSITYMAPMRNVVVLGLYSTYSSKTRSPLIHFSRIIIIIITNIYNWKEKLHYLL